MDQPCIFCQIIQGNIPAHRVYEDADVIAFLDIQQTTKGHTLVVPKAHYDHLLSTPKATVHQVISVAQRIGQAQIQTLGAKGVNFISNALKAAGQTVMHFHVHVIPRYLPSDRLRIEMQANEQKGKLNLPVLADQLKASLEEK
ncbi:MAG: HIT family protein [Bacilli bacterium]